MALSITRAAALLRRVWCSGSKMARPWRHLLRTAGLVAGTCFRAVQQHREIPRRSVGGEDVDRVLEAAPSHAAATLPRCLLPPRNFASSHLSWRLNAHRVCSGTRGELTTNRPRMRCLSDEHGLVALGLTARIKTSALKPLVAVMVVVRTDSPSSFDGELAHR